MTHWSMTIPMQAVPKGRPRFWNGRAVTPKETRDFESEVATRAKLAAPRRLFTGPIEVSLTFYMQKPKRPKWLLPGVRPDLDNLEKSVLDALNGIVFLDDGQICRKRSEKRYASASPMIEIEVTAMETKEQGE